MNRITEYRRIADTELLVSTVCLGTMTFGTPVGETDSIRLVHEAMDLGITFIDTADIYEGYARQLGSPGGVAEEILGKALKNRRDRVVITSKVGNSVGAEPDQTGLGRAHMERQLNASLRRLQTDRLDIYELHKSDSATPLEETVGTIGAFITAGKVRHWGLSNMSPAEIGALLRLCDSLGVPRPVVAQPLYNWLNREAESDYLPICRASRISITPYQPLQGGLLTGKYNRTAPPPRGSRAAEQARWLPALDEKLFDRLDAFTAEASARGRLPLNHALRWLLDQPSISSVVVGCKTPAQLRDIVNAAVPSGGAIRN